MATSGSISSNGYQGRYVVLNWWRTSYSIPNNNTSIHWELKGAGNASSSWYYAGNFKVVIDGVQRYYSSSRIKLYNGTLIASGDVTLGHDAQGNKQFSASIEAGIYTYAVNCTASGSWWLDNIPRYFSSWDCWQSSNTLNSVTINWWTAEPRDWTGWSFQIGIPDNQKSYSGSATYTEYVASDGKSGHFTIKNLSPGTNQLVTIGMKRRDSQLYSYKNITVTTKNIATISSPNSNFSQNSDGSLTIKCNNPSGNQIAYFLDCPSGTRRLTSGKTSNTSYTWLNSQILSMLQYFTTSNSSSIKVGLITYGDNGSSEYYSEKVGTLNVVNSNPTFNNFTYEDTDSTCIKLTGGNQAIIKGYSNVKVKVSVANKAVAKNYASISKYRAVIGEQQKDFNYSSTNEVSTTINDVLSNIFNVYAIDSRGNSTQKQISPSKYLSYSKIVIQEAKVTRTNGVEDETTLYFKGIFWNNSFGSINNSIKSLHYYYKTTTSSTWIDGGSLKPSIDSSEFKFNDKIKGDLGATGFDNQKSFNIKIVAKDELSTSEYQLILGSGTPNIAVHKNGVAIMNMYNTTLGGRLQLNGRVLDKAITQIGTCNNADSCIKPGLYGVGQSAGNLPTNAGGYGVLLVLTNTGEDWKYADTGSWIWQFYMNTAGKLYFRCGVNSSTFSSWKSVTLS